MIRGIMLDENANGIALRKVGKTLRSSVYEQLMWAVDKLGVNDLWDGHISVPELIYRPTGQKIILRGADDPAKLKSVKVSRGRITYIWYEEADQFSGIREIDVINQSLIRGEGRYFCFYTYNPPRSAASPINAEFSKPRADRLVHKSDYRSVPKEWLGNSFIAEAEYLKISAPERYENEYLGIINGTGDEVFRNVKFEAVSDAQIAGFSHTYRGIDWGYGADPFVYIAVAYDSAPRNLYIYDEYYKCGAKFDEIAEEINRRNAVKFIITADSAEPRSNDELRSRGINVRSARKGQGSVEYGIRRLCDLNAIIIDPVRCPNAAREFAGYKLESDGNGGYRSGYPDRDNHTIDAVRYALEERFSRKNVGFIDKRKLGL